MMMMCMMYLLVLEIKIERLMSNISISGNILVIILGELLYFPILLSIAVLVGLPQNLLTPDSELL